jgi:hypothetical protein
MRYKPKSISALQVALGGLPEKMRVVEVEEDVGACPKAVGELRKLAAWPANLAITTPQQRDREGAVRVSKVSAPTRVSPKS